MNIPWLVLAVILAGVWLILHGAAVHLAPIVTVIFGVLIVVFAAISAAPPLLRR